MLWVEAARRHGLIDAAPEGISAARGSQSSQFEANRYSHELERELLLRADLVREQWEIRGPGLLAAIARQPGITIPSEPIEIQLVLPLQGGAAGLSERGQAWLEALLHDVSPQFPEVLRLGWLVALRLIGDPAEAAKLLLNAAAEVDWLVADTRMLNDLQVWLGFEQSAKQLPCETGPCETGPGSQA